jgi:CheY-like chemotaxis protein
MFDKEIPVLLVDDDPDVLTISRLAMRQFEVFGLPVTTYTATSKADAIQLLESRFARQTQVGSRLAVAFVDVVMETDHAGLELCRYIRERLGNRSIQLYVRTGQPGIAPERAVIDAYDVDGYFTKMETTETKLYSLVKSGTRRPIDGLSLTWRRFRRGHRGRRQPGTHARDAPPLADGDAGRSRHARRVDAHGLDGQTVLEHVNACAQAR